MYYKQQQWALAVKFYDKSLAEHRTPEVRTKKAEVWILREMIYTNTQELNILHFMFTGSEVAEGGGREGLY